MTCTWYAVEPCSSRSHPCAVCLLEVFFWHPGQWEGRLVIVSCVWCWFGPGGWGPRGRGQRVNIGSVGWIKKIEDRRSQIFRGSQQQSQLRETEQRSQLWEVVEMKRLQIMNYISHVTVALYSFFFAKTVVLLFPHRSSHVRPSSSSNVQRQVFKF